MMFMRRSSVIVGVFILICIDLIIGKRKHTQNESRVIDVETFMKTINMPTLQQLFGFPANAKVKASRRQLSQKKRSYFVDLKAITESDLKNKMVDIENEINKTGYDASNVRPSRRYVPHDNARGPEWQAAVSYAAAEQILRNMLTLLFLARKLYVEIEKNPYFNSKDPAFRVGFVHLKMVKSRRYIRELMSLMTDRGYYGRSVPTMKIPNRYISFEKRLWRPIYHSKSYYHNTVQQTWWNLAVPASFHQFNKGIWSHGYRHHFRHPWAWNPIDYLRLYVQAVRYHAEFEYLFRIYTRLHERYCNMSHIFMTRPTRFDRTFRYNYNAGKK